MTAVIKNITIDQGADYFRPFILVDENCNPVDLTGAIAAMQLCVFPGYPASLTLTTANGGLVIDGPLGSITPVITAAMTTAMLPGIYVYDIKMVLASGRTIRPFQGNATVNAEVTLIIPMPPSPPPPPSDNQITWGDGTNVTAGDGTNTTWSAASPPPPPADTQVTWSDGTEETAGDGTNTTWSA